MRDKLSGGGGGGSYFKNFMIGLCGPNLEDPFPIHIKASKAIPIHIIFFFKNLSNAWIVNLVRYWNDEKNEKKACSYKFTLLYYGRAEKYTYKGSTSSYSLILKVAPCTTDDERHFTMGR